MTKEPLAMLTIWLLFATLFGAEFLFSPVYSFAEGTYIVFIVLLWFLFLIFFYELLENYFKATDETATIFSVVSATIISFLVIIIFIIYSADDERINTQPIRFTIKDMQKYQIDVIKFCNPNLSVEEVAIIQNDITTKEYLPLFLQYKTAKNKEIKKQIKSEIAAYNKAKFADKQAKQAYKKRREQIKKDFLSQKCKGDEKC